MGHPGVIQKESSDEKPLLFLVEKNTAETEQKLLNLVCKYDRVIQRINDLINQGLCDDSHKTPSSIDNFLSMGVYEKLIKDRSDIKMLLSLFNMEQTTHPGSSNLEIVKKSVNTLTSENIQPDITFLDEVEVQLNTLNQEHSNIAYTVNNIRSEVRQRV